MPLFPFFHPLFNHIIRKQHTHTLNMLFIWWGLLSFINSKTTKITRKTIWIKRIMFCFYLLHINKQFSTWIYFKQTFFFSCMCACINFILKKNAAVSGKREWKQKKLVEIRYEATFRWNNRKISGEGIECARFVLGSVERLLWDFCTEKAFIYMKNSWSGACVW